LPKKGRLSLLATREKNHRKRGKKGSSSTIMSIGKRGKEKKQKKRGEGTLPRPVPDGEREEY